MPPKKGKKGGKKQDDDWGDDDKKVKYSNKMFIFCLLTPINTLNTENLFQVEEKMANLMIAGDDSDEAAGGMAGCCRSSGWTRS